MAKRFLTPLAITASASEVYSVIQGKLRKQEVVRTGVSETVRTNKRWILWHAIRRFRCFSLGIISTEKGF